MCLVWGCVMLLVLEFLLNVKFLIVSEDLGGPGKDLLTSRGPEKSQLYASVVGLLLLRSSVQSCLHLSRLT